MAKRVHHLWPVEPTGAVHEPFQSHRDAAIALLSGSFRLTRKAGQFLGQIALDPTPMSDLQTNWLSKLLERCNLPPLMSDHTS